jgi:hypothetical protein
MLPFFARHRPSEIMIAEVDRYRQEKVRGAISAASIKPERTWLDRAEQIVALWTLEASWIRWREWIARQRHGGRCCDVDAGPDCGSARRLIFVGATLTLPPVAFGVRGKD